MGAFPNRLALPRAAMVPGIVRVNWNREASFIPRFAILVEPRAVPDSLRSVPRLPALGSDCRHVDTAKGGLFCQAEH